MRVPKNCGSGKAKVLIYFPGCRLKPKPFELECLVGEAATAMVEVKQTLLFEGALPNDCKVVVTDENYKVLLTRAIKKSGVVTMNLPGIGRYYAEYTASDYQKSFNFIEISDRDVDISKEVTLCRQRYIKFRYTHSEKDKRTFTNDLTTEIWPTSQLRNLAFDWRLVTRRWQDGDISTMVRFHRQDSGYGICITGKKFDKIRRAPIDGYGYKNTHRDPLEEGDVYFIRSGAHGIDRYTKMEVMEISLDPISK